MHQEWSKILDKALASIGMNLGYGVFTSTANQEDLLH